MDIHVCDIVMAGMHKPRPGELAIRLIDSDPAKQRLYGPLKEGYLDVLRYVFDDMEPEDASPRYVLFDEAIAWQMLQDVRDCRPEMTALMVHCHFGASRSPAVAVALNEIFGLGADLPLYERMNSHVYATLIKTACEKGLFRPGEGQW